MSEMLAQRLIHERYRDSERLRNREWVESHIYKAAVRLFPGGVEVSVRDVDKSRARLGSVSDVPLHLRIPKELALADRLRKDEENRLSSIKRAKREMRWKCKAMQADHMLTFSYRENVTDLARVKKDWREFCRLYKKRFQDFKYVVCLEQQERGAWHLHVAVHGRVDINWVRRCWWMVLGHHVEIVYGSDGKRHQRALIEVDGEWVYGGSQESRGNVDVKGPSKRFGNKGQCWKVDQLSGYLSKYLAKSFEVIESGRRYWPAKEIAIPSIERFWLRSVDFGDAVVEVHNLIRERFMCGVLRIYALESRAVMWFSGSEIVCPF